VRFEIISGPDLVPPRKTRRKQFKIEFVKFPVHWIEALREARHITTYRLALVILAEAFQREFIGGEIVLSSEMTGIPRTSKLKAARELERLGLIRIGRLGRQSLRVIIRS